MSTLKRGSEIVPGIPAGSHHIFPDIPEKGQDHIQDNRGAHGQHRSIHEILPNLAGGNAQPLANGRTNTKGVPLDKVFESVHRTKLEKLNN